MMFLFPAFLGAAALLGVPLALHFLRRKPEEFIPFPTLRFLGATAIRETRRHRIRRWITLLLRCLIVALLAAAFARPFFVAKRGDGKRALVIAIDNSYSMQAAGRWESFQDWGQQQLKGLKTGDQAALLLVNPSPTWLVPMTDNLSTVRDALAQRQPGFHTTRYNTALRMAGAVLAETTASERTIAWMADEQRLGWMGVDFDATLPAGVKFEFASPAGQVGRQASITQASVSTSNGKAEVQVAVRLYEPATAERTLTIYANQEPVATRKLELSRDKPNAVTVPLENLSTPAAIKVVLDPDDLPTDDTAYISAEPPPRTKVLLGDASMPSGEADFLGHAIDSTRGIETQPLSRAPLSKDAWSLQSVVVLRGGEAFRPANVRQLDDHLARGGRAWLWVDGDADQLAWLASHGIRATASRQTAEYLRDLDTEHPVVSFFGQKSLLPLLQIEFRKAWALTSANLEPVARWQDQSIAMGEQAIGDGRIFISGFAATRTASDWPTRASFVPFVHQTITWLADAAVDKKSWKVGDTIPLPEGSGTWTTIDSPRPQPPGKVQGSVVPGMPGIYQYETAGLSKRFAVNLSPEESDLTPMLHDGDLQRLESKERSRVAPTHSPRLPQTDAEQQQTLWWWLLAAAGVFLLGELALANRTAL